MNGPRAAVNLTEKIICKPASACCEVCRPQISGTSSNCKLHLVVVKVKSL